MFNGEARLINKVKKLLQEALDSGLLTSCDTVTNLHEESPPKKKSRRDPETWLQLDGALLSNTDREIVCNGGWLNDKHINYAQSLLKKQFPHLHGWRKTLLLRQEQKKIKKGVQIILTHGNHWMVVSNV